jgi:HEAT repeat protein
MTHAHEVWTKRAGCVLTVALLAGLAGCGTNANGGPQVTPSAGPPPKLASGEKIATLVAQLQSSDARTRADAADALRVAHYFHKEIQAADLPKIVTALIANFGDDDEKVRRWSAEACGTMGLPAVEPLIQATRHKDPHVRTCAFFALSGLDKETKEAKAGPVVEALTAGLKDEDVEVRKRVAHAFDMFDSLAKKAIPDLIAALKDWKSQHKHVTCNLVNCVGKMGPDAKAALPIVEELRESDDNEIRKAAGAAYQRITGQESLR